MQAFSDWLQLELDERGWSKSEFARIAEMDTGTVSNILNEVRKPGKVFCKKTAKALGIKESTVLYHAGFIGQDPSDPTQALGPALLDIISMLQSTSEKTQNAARQAIELFLENFGDGKRSNEDSKATSKSKR